jgi:phosphohistidine swiveling domain-containing protein
MRIEPLTPDQDEQAWPLQRWAAAGLPVPPSWLVYRADVLDTETGALVQALSELTHPDEHRYWVMQQGAVNAESLRRDLANLDSDAALAAALEQFFRADDAPDAVVIQSLPARRAAGVLFSRHPMRPDLDHIVVEGMAEGADEKERMILQRSGEIAWSRSDAGALPRIGGGPFMELVRQLAHWTDVPQACEWIFDGEHLWLLQSLPVGSLPSPVEVWTRRHGMGLWTQVVSPLWYTLESRWLKVHFWRNLGRRLGWTEMENLEPYRRVHSHIYTNARFLRELHRLHPVQALQETLPPAWRNADGLGTDRRVRRLRTRTAERWSGWQLRRLERRLDACAVPSADNSRDNLWHFLIHLDRLGERLAREEGLVNYLRLPGARPDEPVPLAWLLAPDELQGLQTLGRTPAAEALREAVPHGTAGADPVVPRFRENPVELESLQALAPERCRALLALRRDSRPPEALLLRARARSLRYRLGGIMRQQLLRMAAILVDDGLLQRTEDIFFLYFDEFWQVWNGQGGVNADGLGQRKLRYMNDAHQGAPDWIMDQVGYGINLEGETHPLLRGRGWVPGRVAGATRRLHSAWELSSIEAGDVLVLDQCDPGWLPWLSLASALVLASQDPLDPAAALARELDIPAVRGLDDAMHCLPDGTGVVLDGETGEVSIRHQPDGGQGGT